MIIRNDIIYLHECVCNWLCGSFTCFKWNFVYRGTSRVCRCDSQLVERHPFPRTSPSHATCCKRTGSRRTGPHGQYSHMSVRHKKLYFKGFILANFTYTFEYARPRQCVLKTFRLYACDQRRSCMCTEYVSLWNIAVGHNLGGEHPFHDGYEEFRNKGDTGGLMDYSQYQPECFTLVHTNLFTLLYSSNSRTPQPTTSGQERFSLGLSIGCACVLC